MDGSWLFNIVSHVCRTFYRVYSWPCFVLSCPVSSVCDTTLLVPHYAYNACHTSHLLHVASRQIGEHGRHSMNRARSNQYVFNIATLPKMAYMVAILHLSSWFLRREHIRCTVLSNLASPSSSKLSTIDTWLIMPLSIHISIYHTQDCTYNALYNKMEIH